MKTLARLAMISSVLAFAAPALALTATQTVQKEVISVQADGTETVTYESAEMVTPGERVQYALNYENDGVEPASNLVLTMPVPEVVIYNEGSSTGGTVMSYSADGGKTFADRNSLVVVMADGGTRPAQAEDISHIRWNIAGPVASGEAGLLAFSGTLK